MFFVGPGTPRTWISMRLKEEPPKWPCLIVLLVFAPTNPKKDSQCHKKGTPQISLIVRSLPFWVPWVPPAVPPGQPLTIFSPKAGPMKDDFEKLGLEVSIVDAWPAPRRKPAAENGNPHFFLETPMCLAILDISYVHSPVFAIICIFPRIWCCRLGVGVLERRSQEAPQLPMV